MNKKTTVMRGYQLTIVVVTLSACLSGCKSEDPIIKDEAVYLKETEAWQQKRLEKLKDKDGWLSLAGLFWLEEGQNSFGSDSSNNIVFPEKAPAFCGTLVLDGGIVKISVADGVEISRKNRPVTEMVLADDQTKNTTYLEMGDLGWNVIKRGDKYGIRLRDYNHPRIGQLDHIPSYPIQPGYVVEATLEPFDAPVTMTLATPVEGFTEEYQCPGILKFRINGRELTLHPFTSGNGYFLVIADETTGLDTYGAGRFMYAYTDFAGRIILDFNRAYNPPCAFSPYATCPMPPRENFLPVAIEAGEKSVHLH
jgi:uncharacterized protein (DUF1684 family)